MRNFYSVIKKVLFIFVGALIFASCQEKSIDYNFTYPQGKFKALILSYDDGTIEDIKLAQLFDKHDLIGTFNLNSGFLGTTRGWPQKDGDTVYQRYVPKDSLTTIYKNHEIGVHGAFHKNFKDISNDEILKEIDTDIKELKALTGRDIVSMAYPYGATNTKIAKLISNGSIINGRTINNTYKFGFPKNYMLWKPTCHDRKVLDLVDSFIELNGKGLSLFYVWGHSWEFKDEQRWNNMKTFCEKIGKENDIWFVGNGEFTLYIEALKKVTVKEGIVSNPLDNPTIWIEINNEITFIPPGNSISLK